MKVLVTGGAGYIGSVVVEGLIQRKYDVVVVDNLQSGHKGAIHQDAKFFQFDIGDEEKLGKVFGRYQIDSVVHLAADSIVESSMKNPGCFFQNNISSSINLLNVMVRYGVSRIIFSSSAAVYGIPERVPIIEEQLKVPVNAYGETKLIIENLMKWYENAHGLKHVSLRYFNAAGASETHGEDHRPETHLIPNLLKVALGARNQVNIYGNDYPTRDGTCVRDYVHVADIASAHILALEKIEDLRYRVYNLGNGEGYTVKEVLDATTRVTGNVIDYKCCPRRLGDPASLVASSDLARRELGWKPEFSEIDSIIMTAWKWAQSHPEGY